MAPSTQYESVIGLEVHAELLTASKIFCACSARFGAAPNENTCPVCTGMPGVLPVPNRRVIEFGVRAGLAVGCNIARYSRWARKNYFYPDLPKGYQISQLELPLCQGGTIEIETDSGGHKAVHLTRIHMEEDTGKNIHDAHGDASLVDFNRCGVPLLEIVSEPDMRSPEEAGAYLRRLRALLRYLEVCDGNMEEGSFRCDANVSIRPVGSTKLGTKVEIKNMNSFRAVEKAIAYEVERQAAVLGDGGALKQETRLWDPDREMTRSMRSKEFADDYRYFPDPDLPPLVVSERWINEIRDGLPELPAARRERFVREYGLPAYDADVLTTRKDVADYYEAAVRAHSNPKAISNWVMGDLLRIVRERKLDDSLVIRAWPIRPEHVAHLVKLIDDGQISGKIAKTVFEEMLESGADPIKIVADKGLVQMSDDTPILQAIDAVLSANADKVAEFRAGKDKLFGFFVGQVMKATQGKANPQKLNTLLKERLTQ